MLPLSIAAMSTVTLLNVVAVIIATETADVSVPAWINGGAALTNLGVLVFTLRWFMGQAEAVRLQQKLDAEANRQMQKEVLDDQLKESREVRRSLNKNTEAILLMVIDGRNSSQEAKTQAQRILNDVKTATDSG